jgi:hypothetical protein
MTVGKEIYMTNFEPTSEELRRAEIVLSDALPYELMMLDVAARYTQTSAFANLEKTKKTAWFIHNATVEAFWTHTRCILEFFNRGKNNNFDTSSASARDFTSDDYEPSKEITALWGPGTLQEKINEQISHVGFRRKTELYEKLGTEMPHVKAAIDRETIAFDRKLLKKFRAYWKWTPPTQTLVFTNSATTSCNAITIIRSG